MKRRAAFWAIVGAALALRAAYGFYRAPLRSPATNPDCYTELADSYARTGTLSEPGQDGRPSALREPGYPVYLGLWFMLFGATHGAVLAANAGLTVLFFVAFLGAGRRLFGEDVALLACAVAALYPAFVYYSAIPLRETAMLAFSTSALWALLEARRRGTFLAFAGAGAAAALAGLVNTTLLPFFLILAPLVLIALERGRRGRTALLATSYALVLALVYAPWPIRNWRQTHTWIVGSLGSAGGSNLYIYQVVPEADGGTERQVELLKNDPAMLAVSDPSITPLQRDHMMWTFALKRIAADPWAYARLASWRFFVDTWRLWPRPRAYEHSYAALKAAGLLSDGWIIPLGFVGMGLAAAFGAPEAVLPILFVLSMDFIYALFLTMLRYRLVMMPWMILFAAGALDRLRRRLLEARS